MGDRLQPGWFEGAAGGGDKACWYYPSWYAPTMNEIVALPGVVSLDGEWYVWPINVVWSRDAWKETKKILADAEPYPTREAAMFACMMINSTPTSS